ncbi:hypothetical protein D9M73_184430 [compost metagenome]
MTGNAELLGIGGFQRSVETTPENHPGDKPAEGQETQAVMHTGPTQHTPIILEQGKQRFHGLSSRFRLVVDFVLQDLVDVLEAVAHQWLHILLRHVTLVAEVAAR